MEFVRTRRIPAQPERVWPFVEDPTKWPLWFTEARRCEVISGAGVGRRQRMYGTARGKATEIDQTVTAYEPPRLLRWHHDEERVEGKVAPVVYARDAVAEIVIEPDGDASAVTFRLLAEPGSLLFTLILRFLARGPIGVSFETSLRQLEERVLAGPAG